MTEFNISRGLSTVLFTPEGQVNPNLVIEEGCWYLCTDTAELFLGVQTEEGLSLMQINDVERHPVIAEVKTKVENVLIPKVEEEIVPTISEVKSTTEELKAWVDNKEFLQHIDLEGYATEEFVTEAISGIKVQASDIYKVDYNAPNFAEALEAYNSGKVLVLINAAPDINSYAVMNYVNDKYITFTKFLMSRSEAYGAFNTYYLGSDNVWEIAKEVKLNKVEANVNGEIAGELSTIRIGKEIFSIPSTDGFATEDFVHEMIAKAELDDKDVDLEAYYTKAEVDELIPDVTNLVTKTEFDIVQQQSASNNVKIFQIDEELFDINQRIDNIDLTSYATKEEVTAVEEKIPSTEGLATKQELDDAIAAIKHPTVDLEGYATENYVDAKFAEIKVPTAVSELNNDAGYITANDIPEVNLSNYYTKSETETLVNEAVNGIELPDTTGFITMGDVEAKGYLTSDDIADKADKSELASLATKEEVEAVEGKIPSLENYATKQDVADAVAGIEIPEVPEVNLENYHTKAEITELLGVKANEVPFKTAKFVTHAIGDFVSGDNVIDLTLAQLFAKLLGLVDEPGETPEEPDEPVEPDVPKEFDSVAEKIDATKLPMYSITEDGQLAPVSFKLVDKDAEPTESGFYAVKDAEGNIIQAGYQDVTINNDEMYYVIALPKEVDYDKVVTLYSWDPDDEVWVDSELRGLTSDPDVVAELCDEAGIDISHIDTDVYTVWALPDVCTGSILRYEFKEELL